VVDNLAWPSFKELISDHFTSEYQDIRDGVALVRLKQTGSLRGYVQESNAHLNVFFKARRASQEDHLLQWIARLGTTCFVQNAPPSRDLSGVVETCVGALFPPLE